MVYIKEWYLAHGVYIIPGKHSDVNTAIPLDMRTELIMCTKSEQVKHTFSPFYRKFLEMSLMHKTLALGC